MSAVLPETENQARVGARLLSDTVLADRLHRDAIDGLTGPRHSLAGDALPRNEKQRGDP